MRSVLVRREFTSRFSLTLLALRAQDILQPIVRHGLLCLDPLNRFAVSH